MEGAGDTHATTWSYTREKKKSVTTGMTNMKPPIQCKTCGQWINAYNPPTIYGGVCYPCDVDAAFEAGKKRSESQTHSFRAHEQEVTASKKSIARGGTKK